MRTKDAARIRHGILYARSISKLFAVYTTDVREFYYQEMSPPRRGVSTAAYERELKAIDKRHALAKAYAKGRAICDALVRP